MTADPIVTVTLNPTLDRVIEVSGLRLGGHLKGRLRSITPAGKAFNVACAYTALGGRARAIGWVGRDSAASFARAADEAGVENAFTVIEGATRQNITLIDPDTGGTETHIREAGPTVTERDIAALARALEAVSRQGTVVVFTGSAAPGLAPAMFGRLLDDCIGRGARVVVDTSGDLLHEAARRRLWLLKPNLLELEELTGTATVEDDTVIEAGWALASAIELVIVTAGERGAWCLARQAGWYGHVAMTASDVRSTVGCGDAFLAGFLHAHCHDGRSIDEALGRALAVASASAMTDRPAAFDAGTVRRLLDRAVVRAIPQS